jgi:hypothetical protein
MQPVVIFALPHNYRDEIYPEGEGPSFCHYYEPGEPRGPVPVGIEWAMLPMPMPTCLITIIDGDGKAIAAAADGKWVRWKDLRTVLTAVRQYNADCTRQGIAELKQA